MAFTEDTHTSVGHIIIVSFQKYAYKYIRIFLNPLTF